MLVTAAKFSDYVLAVHIIAVVVSFGMTFVYPVFAVVGARLDLGMVGAVMGVIVVLTIFFMALHLDS